MTQDVDRHPVGSRVRQTPKSIATRQRVIEAAISCFLEIGYHRTNTAEIAKRAGITRGAVQYYFPTTGDVLSASAEHIADSFTHEFEARLVDFPPGGDPIDFAIDVLWDISRGRLWTAWLELDAASRTDEELRTVLEPVSIAFAEKQEQVARTVYKSFVEADPLLFELTRMMSWQFLQGLSRAQLGVDGDATQRRMVQGLKDVMHGVWGLPRGVPPGTPAIPFWAPARANG